MNANPTWAALLLAFLFFGRRRRSSSFNDTFSASLVVTLAFYIVIAATIEPELWAVDSIAFGFVCAFFLAFLALPFALTLFAISIACGRSGTIELGLICSLTVGAVWMHVWMPGSLWAQTAPIWLPLLTLILPILQPQRTPRHA